MKRLALLLLVASVAHAATSIAPLPDAPKPQPKMDKVQWSLLTADAGFRALDVYSTRRALANPRNHESILPDWISSSTPALIGFEATVVTAEYFGARLLIKHHHPRWAKVLTAIDLSGVAYSSVNNLFLPTGK
jgi:hypothetical protein